MPSLPPVGDPSYVEQLDLAVWPIFYRASVRGLLVDIPKLEALLADVQAQRAEVLSRIEQLAGRPINPNAGGDVASWMEEQGLGGKRTKSRDRLATDERSLVAHHHPLLDAVLEFRGLQKLETTFILPTLALAKRNGGTIHPRWKLTRVKSGRVACEDPNLMAFPSRDKIGIRVRDCFVARPGMVYISADFSQIEPRVAAALSEDPRLLEIYRTGRDIYTETARSLFHLSEEIGRETPGFDLRYRLPSKTTTLGVLYGMAEERLYEQLVREGCGYWDGGEPGAGDFVPYFDAVEQFNQWNHRRIYPECKALIDGWFETYPRVQALVDATVELARANGGWASTVGGRRRFLPALFLEGDRWPAGKLREEAERQGFNHRVQGTSQEEMKRAMVRVDEALGAYVYPLLQIHDDLTVETAEETAEEIAATVKAIMETEFRGVQLKVDTKIGHSWKDVK